jgi:hypothetical protein
MSKYFNFLSEYLINLNNFDTYKNKNTDIQEYWIILKT